MNRRALQSVWSHANAFGILVLLLTCVAVPSFAQEDLDMTELSIPDWWDPTNQTVPDEWPELLDSSDGMPYFFTLLDGPPVWFYDWWAAVQKNNEVDELPQWFVDLVSVPECFASFKPVTIDTASSEGGVARTSFLFLEVEADQDIVVEVQACPEGYGVPARGYLVHPTCSWYENPSEECPTDEEILADPAKYACKTEDHGHGHTWTHCSIHVQNYDHHVPVCCPKDKSTFLIVDSWQDRQDSDIKWPETWESVFGICTAAKFPGPELHDVDLRGLSFDTSDAVKGVPQQRMDGREGRAGPFTIKEVYAKFPDRASLMMKHAYYPELSSSTNVLAVGGVSEMSEGDVVSKFTSMILRYWECPDDGNDCYEDEKRIDATDVSYLGKDPEDDNIAYVDFPNWQSWEVSDLVRQSTDRWSDLYDPSLKISFRDCKVAGSYLPNFKLPPFAENVVSTYFSMFYKEPIPGNDEIRAQSQITPFSSIVSKDVSGTCRLLVTLADIPDMQPMELVSIDGVPWTCLAAAYDSVPDAYIALDAFTALKRTTGAAPAAGEAFVVEVRNFTNTSSSVVKHTVTATSAVYTSMKSKLDSRNDKRWGQNFVCGGMDYDRTGGKVNPASPDQNCTAHRIASGVTREVDDARARAIEDMWTNKTSFSWYLGSRNLETGKQDWTFLHSTGEWFDGEEMSVDDFEGCRLRVHGTECHGENDGVEMRRSRQSCNFEKLFQASDGIERLITKVENREQSATWADFVEFTTTDAWINCMDIVSSAMEDNYEREPQLTTRCVVNNPCDWQTMDHDDADRVQACDHGTWGYCKENPDDAWCADPCCNIDKQREMCCAPREVPVDVFRPTFNTANFVANCLRSDTEARGGELDTCKDITAAVAPADFISQKLARPEICLTEIKEVPKKITAVQKDFECCLRATVGEWSWSDNMFVSSMPCTSNADCKYSGTCIVTAKDSAPEDDGCGWSETEHENTCSVASSADVGTSLAKCLEARIPANQDIGKVADATWANLKMLLTANLNATNEKVGEGILEKASYQTCRGDDSWRFDPHCWGPECSDCEGAAECKAACLDAKTCNWKPWSWNETSSWRTTEDECLDASRSTMFCAAENPWGGIEDLTREGFCRPIAPMVKAKYEWYHRAHWYQSHEDVTTATCQELDSSLVAVNEDAWDERKHCVWKENSMSSDRTACLNECLNEIQPPKKYECYVDLNATTGKCPSTGWFTSRREDWEVDLPGDISRPTYCVADFWGPNGLAQRYGYPWDGSPEAEAGWTVTLASSGVAGAYRIWEDASWMTVIGHSDWWNGLTFTTEATANTVCAELDANYRIVDDGSWSCGEDQCYYPDISTHYDCAAMNIQHTDTEFEWKGAYRSGSGMCLGRPAAPVSHIKNHKITVSSSFTADGETDYVSINGYHWYRMDTASYCDKGTTCTQFSVRSYEWNPINLTVGNSVEFGGASYTVSAIEAIPPPLYDGYDFEGNKVMRNCYASGTWCDAVSRDWYTNPVNWTNYSSWEIGYQATLNSKAHCEASGGTSYFGRQYKEGSFDSEAKCASKFCSVLGPHYLVDDAMCNSIGGKCSTWQGCEGCRRPEWWEADNENTKEGVCYKSVTNATDCSSTFVESLAICMDSTDTNRDQCSNTWLTCEDLLAESCSGTIDVTTLHGYVSQYLNCKKTKEPRFCKTKQQCESETGECHGPQLRDEICYHDYELDSHVCETFTHTCKVQIDEDKWECPGHTCDGNPNAHNHTYSVYDAFGNETQVTETYCWDEKRFHVFDKYCLDYYIGDEAECTAANGDWLRIDIKTQQEFCLSSKRCEGGRSELGWTGERKEAACLECGGRMRTDSEWVTGEWLEPSMVSSDRTYATRAMGSTNTWSTFVDEWKMRDFMRSIEKAMYDDANALFARCMYGELASSMEKLSAECGGLDAAERRLVLGKATTKFNAISIPGTQQQFGNVDDTTVETSPGTCNTTNLSTTCALKIEENQEPLSEANLTCAARRKLLDSAGARRLLQTDATGSTNDASCWSRVRNDNNALVGQLLGDCVALTFDEGQQLGSGVRFCLRIKTEREVAADYTIDAFVSRTIVSDAKQFKPYTVTVERVGEQLCATVSDEETVVCPARLAATWETASADVGSDACGVVDVLLSSQAEVQREIATEIEAGTFGYSITAETVIAPSFDSSPGSESSESVDDPVVDDPVSATSPTFSASILVLASALMCFFV